MAIVAPKAVRVRTSTGWVDVALVGPPGAKGDDGVVDIYEQPNTPPVNAPVGALWIDTDDPTPVPATGPTGPPGPPGPTNWYSGSGPPPGYGTPTSALGGTGDYYLDTNAGMIYKRQAGSYPWQSNTYIHGTPIWRGVWSSGIQYAAQDAVSYQGQSWVANQGALGAGGAEPGGTLGLWDLLAAKGTAGATGPAGASGAPGPATLETYIGPNAPTPRGDYTVWIDTDEPQASWLPPTRVTSLPASPFDGQEVYLVADAGPPVVLWHMRRNAALAKWEFMGGPPIAYRQEGEFAGYITFPTAGNALAVNGAGKLLAWAITPPVDVWADVTFHIGQVQKVDAAYHYTQLQIGGAVAPPIGSYPQVTKTQHSQVMQFEPYLVRGRFGLTAGVGYSFYLLPAISGGSWSYYAGNFAMQMFGEAWPR
jgi:hypothetical protein